MLGVYPLVTIAIPCYKRADTFLKRAVECALHQTYPNLEVIVADNCSEDSTPELMASYLDKRLKYFRHPQNIGATANINFCIERASGDYLLLLPDDDQIDPDFVETCIKAAEHRTDFGLIRTGVRVIDEEGRTMWESPNRVSGLSIEDFFHAWFAQRTSWYMVNTLFITKLLRGSGGFHSRHKLLDDGMAIARLAACSGRVDVPDVKASFRKHDSELTFAANVSDWAEDFLDLMDLICSLVPPDKSDRLRKEGTQFFAKLCYDRAAAVESRYPRLLAYLRVFRIFKYNYLPPRGAQWLVALRILESRARKWMSRFILAVQA
jgi:glycosyltransferase involved in cell wall biosynthesis